jgi:hypothetical protein
MSSIINQDIKGVIYIIGLITACFLAIIIGNVMPEFGGPDIENELKNPVCNLIALGDNVTFSKLPLGQTILMFTFFYFVYVIAIHNLAMTNIPTLIFFPLLIIADIYWNMNNNCYNPLSILTAFIIGGGCGIGWSAIIDSFGQPSMMYFNVGSNANVCSRPSKQLFKCSFGTNKNPTDSKQTAANKLGEVIGDLTHNEGDAEITKDTNDAVKEVGNALTTPKTGSASFT